MVSNVKHFLEHFMIGVGKDRQAYRGSEKENNDHGEEKTELEEV